MKNTITNHPTESQQRLDLVVVLGMHRTGTSAITCGLQSFGLELGQNLMPGLIDNAKGFWEDLDIVDFNNELLDYLDLRWDSLLSITSSSVSSLAEAGYLLRAANIIRRKLVLDKTIGIKDPRMAKLIPFWKHVFEHCQLNVGYILTTRNPLSVAKSLEKRDGFPPEKSYMLWLDHTLTALLETEGSKRSIVDFDLLIENPARELNRLAKTLDLKVDPLALSEYVTNFLDKHLRHNFFEFKDLALDPKISPLIRETYAIMREAAVDDRSFVLSEEQRKYNFTHLNSSINSIEFLQQISSAHANYIVKFECEVNHLNHALNVRDESLMELNQAVALRDGQLAELSQVVAHRDGMLADLNQAVALRDGQLAELSKVVTHRDGMLADLNQAVALRDGQLAELSQVVAHRDGLLVDLNQAVDLRDRRLAELNQAVARRDRFLAQRERTENERNRQIMDLELALTQLRTASRELSATVESACRWQKRSWFRRAFHKWRPGPKARKIHPLRKLERSIRKKRKIFLIWLVRNHEKLDSGLATDPVNQKIGSDTLSSSQYVDMIPDHKISRNSHFDSQIGNYQTDINVQAESLSALQLNKDALRKEAHENLLKFLNTEDQIDFSSSGSVDLPRVSVIIVLYNQAGLTLECLRSLRRCQGVSLQIIVVDNASTDETFRLMEKVSGVIFIRNEDNLHFLRSVNQAADYATGEYLLLLNNDAMPEPNAISAAVSRIESSATIGAVGGKIILCDGSLQEAGSIIWNDGSCLGYGRGGNPKESEFQFARSVDYCSGAFLLTKRNLFEKLQRLDLSYCPAYYEETDYCVRLIDLGLEVYYDPLVEVRHFEFASSVTSQSALDLQRRNQSIFVTKHKEFLSHQSWPSALRFDILSARQRLKPGRKRILIIEDRVPHVSLGSGYPRANSIIHLLAEQDHAITLYPLQFPQDDWKSVYHCVPDTVEVMLGLGNEGLKDFLKERCGYYDILFISRPHNMKVFKSILALEPDLLECAGFRKPLLVYDAEALYSLREDAEAIAKGTPNSDEMSATNLGSELDLVKGSDKVLAVSESEADIFRSAGCDDVVVLGHTVNINESSRLYSMRSGFLFVGAMHCDDCPNSDSIIWFATEIWPMIRESLGDNIRFDIVGLCNSKQVGILNGINGITVHGKVDSLDPYFVQARVFVVPTRFSAGIPHKAHEAASRGLPMVTTNLIAKQLSWEDSVLASDSPVEFARHCIELYNNETQWKLRQESVIRSVRRDCGIENFKSVLYNSLGVADL